MTPPRVEASDLATAMIRFADAIAAVRRNVGEMYRITATEVRAAMWIAVEDRLTPTGLARRLSVTSGATTIIIDHLARAGIARRIANPGDGRSSLLQLTERGQAMVNHELRLLDASLGQAGQIESTVDDAARILTTITSNLRSAGEPLTIVPPVFPNEQF